MADKPSLGDEFIDISTKRLDISTGNPAVDSNDRLKLVTKDRDDWFPSWTFDHCAMCLLRGQHEPKWDLWQNAIWCWSGSERGIPFGFFHNCLEIRHLARPSTSDRDWNQFLWLPSHRFRVAISSRSRDAVGDCTISIEGRWLSHQIELAVHMNLSIDVTHGVNAEIIYRRSR